MNALVTTRHAAERTAASMRLRLGSRIASLAAIAGTAPLFGLFGTTVMLVRELQSVTIPVCGICDVAGGPADTLVPLLLSLPVAVFARAGLRYLRRQVEIFDLEMRLSTLDVLEELRR